MAAKPHSRSWNDVQTAIATVAVVTTLGLWNLFATPSKAKAVQAAEPVVPPTEPPVETEAPVAAAPTEMPQVKIMFTPGVTPTVIVQAQTNQQAPVKKKRNKNNGGGGSSTTTSVTQTKTS